MEIVISLVFDGMIVDLCLWKVLKRRSVKEFKSDYMMAVVGGLSVRADFYRKQGPEGNLNRRCHWSLWKVQWANPHNDPKRRNLQQVGRTPVVCGFSFWKTSSRLVTDMNNADSDQLLSRTGYSFVFACNSNRGLFRPTRITPTAVWPDQTSLT